MERITFPAYFIVSALQAMSWPRKKGFLRRAVVAGPAVSGAYTGMVQASMGLGAGRPFLACQLLTDLLSGGYWASAPVDTLIATLDPSSRVHQQPRTMPWEVIVLIEMEPTYKSDFIPWDSLFGRETLTVASVRSSEALTYGLVHPAEVGAALDTDRAQYVARAPEMIQYGLNISAKPTFSDNESYFQWTEQTVRAYEARCGQLPQPAPQLLAAAVVHARGLIP
jgi:hypothetical protein